MARVEIPEVIWQSTTIAGQSALAPKPGASVQVNLRGGGAATVMDAESGGSSLTNPLTADSLGRVFGWLEEGSYDIVVDGDGANTFRLEAVRGTRTDIILGSDVSLTRVAANVLGLGANDGIAIPGASVNALPGSPQDGQIIAYRADATNGIIWLFQYRAASASSYKWEFIGGSPLTALIDTYQGVTSTTFVDLTTPGPTVTVPLAGDYLVTIDAHQYFTAGTGLLSAFMSFAVGATPADVNDRFWLQKGAANLNEVQQGHRMVRKNAVGAGSALTAKYAVSGTSANSTFGGRQITAIPVRVG